MNENLTFQNILAIIEPILSPFVEFCFLMGSVDTPRFNKDSDIDIAVYWKNPDINVKMDLVAELNKHFDQSIDLVSLNDVDVIFGMQVFEKGRLLFGSNPGLLLKWKAEQLSKYPDFKVSRLVIEKNILNRKKYV